MAVRHLGRRQSLQEQIMDESLDRVRRPTSQEQDKLPNCEDLEIKWNEQGTFGVIQGRRGERPEEPKGSAKGT
jgi:hypothetical protein